MVAHAVNIHGAPTVSSSLGAERLMQRFREEYKVKTKPQKAQRAQRKYSRDPLCSSVSSVVKSFSTEYTETNPDLSQYPSASCAHIPRQS